MKEKNVAWLPSIDLLFAQIKGNLANKKTHSLLKSPTVTLHSSYHFFFFAFYSLQTFEKVNGSNQVSYYYFIPNDYRLNNRDIRWTFSNFCVETKRRVRLIGSGEQIAPALLILRDCQIPPLIAFMIKTDSLTDLTDELENVSVLSY